MKKNGMIIIALAVLVSLVPLSAFAEDELFDTQAANEHLEKGLAELRAKNYDAALEEFEESASIAPEAEAFYYLGYTYYLKGRAGDEESRKLSLENFDKAYEIDPNFSPTRYKPAEAVPGQQQEMQPEEEQTPAPGVTEQQPSAPAVEPGAESEPAPTDQQAPAPEEQTPAPDQPQQ